MEWENRRCDEKGDKGGSERRAAVGVKERQYERKVERREREREGEKLRGRIKGESKGRTEE